MTLRPAVRRALLWIGLVLLWNAVVLLATFGPTPTLVRAAAPQLWLPTPIGERWQVLQGFQCGSHVGTQSRSLDLINLDGSTTGAPVRAAADGTTFVWEGSTGTLIVAHGDGYYTMYTHLQQVITTRRGLQVRRGDVIGRAGSVGTGVPHLHFTFFYAPDSGAYNRTSLELDFADGFSFRDTAGCSQHRGEIVVARADPDTIPPEVRFSSPAQPEQWYCEDHRVDFTISDNVRVEGFSQAFDRDPGGDAPEFKADEGYVQIAWEGEGLRTLYVRAWDYNGQQTLATFGPVGYDDTAPTFPAPSPVPARTYPADQPLNLAWTPADDDEGSGIAGYKLYLGTDSQGTSDWFSEAAKVRVEGLKPGRYLLRGQAQDRACHSSEWVTLQEVIVVAEDGTEAPAATETPTPSPESSATPKATAPPATSAPDPDLSATPAATEPAATEAPATSTPTAPPATTEAPAATEVPAQSVPDNSPTPSATPTATAPPAAGGAE